MAHTVPYHGARNEPAPPPTSNTTASPDEAYEETLPATRGSGGVGQGSKVGRYDVLERIGAGGMGEVFRAHDPELHREVALKLLKAGRTSGKANSKRRKRLLREARAMAQLSHPNVIPVYDVGVYGDGLYIAMEFVLGSNAREWIRAVKPPWRRTLGVFRAAGRGLAAAHTAGLVHRDFKPANVMVGDDGRVRVLDFGLARAAVDGPESLQGDHALEPGHAEVDLDGNWSETLTADGTILGTPVYMAPEQYAGKHADARTDQYSYCLALYEALYLQLPFKGRTVKDQARAKYHGQIREPPSRSKVPRRLFHVLRRGLSPSPDDRFPSMPDLLRELRTVQQENKSTPTPWRAWAAVFGVIALTAGLVVTAGMAQPPPPAPVAVCPSAEESLAGAWDDPRREQTQQAFIDSEVAGAEDRWQEMATRLDERTATWTELYDRACAEPGIDSRTRRLHRARLACLERHRGDLEAFVDALAEPTAVVVHRAASAVHGLPSLEDCEDQTALLASADRDAGQHTRVVELDRRIGRARALRTTGQAEAAREEIDQVIERAGVEDLRPVTGRALLERAYLHRSATDMAAAELDLRAAYFNAVADRRARVAATAAVGLVDVLAALDRTDDALAWSEHARAHIYALDSALALDAALRQALAHVGAAEKKGTESPADQEADSANAIPREHDE
ncbi:MAG: serine/threonine-protein kinase [Myxococcota bacterium]